MRFINSFTGINMQVSNNYMNVSGYSLVCLSGSLFCGFNNAIMAPTVFAAGFTTGFVAGLIYNLMIRRDIFKKCDEEFEEEVKGKFLSENIQKLNPFSHGEFDTLLSFVAMKVNEYAITFPAFYNLSVLAGVPLGIAAGRAFAMLPWGNYPSEYKDLLARTSL
jgi:hypothetical protein